MPDGTVPNGFGVPFHFYDRFMKHNGLFVYASKMIAKSSFQSTPDKRQKELKKKKKREEKLERKRLKKRENSESEPEKGEDEQAEKADDVVEPGGETSDGGSR